MRVAIIADDLTGALDAAGPFANRGLKTICALSPSSLVAALALDPDVVAVSTSSRALSDDEAARRVAEARALLEASETARGAIWFKKIDSRLKGPIAAETAALRRDGQAVVICPAIPRLGRYVRRGAVCGAGVETPLAVLETTGCIDAKVLDGDSQKAILAGLGRASANTLWVGAAGLAEALAEFLEPSASMAHPPKLQKPALFAIGSRDPVTLAQIEGLPRLIAPNGAAPAPQEEAPDFTVIQMTAGEPPMSDVDAAARFSRSVARWLNRANAKTLLACGGECAGAIAAELNVDLLRIDGEVMPGLPASTAITGREGLRFVTKSGGFGERDTLVNLAARLENA